MIAPPDKSKNRLIRLVILVLPAPVEPTRAIFCPGLASRLTSCSTGLSGLYWKNTWSKRIWPCTGICLMLPSVCFTFHTGFCCVSFRVMVPKSDSGSSSISWKIRSAPANAFSRELNCWEICVIGWENERVYCKNAATVPKSNRPKIAMILPKIAVMA